MAPIDWRRRFETLPDIELRSRRIGCRSNEKHAQCRHFGYVLSALTHTQVNHKDFRAPFGLRSVFEESSSQAVSGYPLEARRRLALKVVFHPSDLRF